MSRWRLTPHYAITALDVKSDLQKFDIHIATYPAQSAHLFIKYHLLKILGEDWQLHSTALRRGSRRRSRPIRRPPGGPRRPAPAFPMLGTRVPTSAGAGRQRAAERPEIRPTGPALLPPDPDGPEPPPGRPRNTTSAELARPDVAAAPDEDPPSRGPGGPPGAGQGPSPGRRRPGPSGGDRLPWPGIHEPGEVPHVVGGHGHHVPRPGRLQRRSRQDAIAVEGLGRGRRAAGPPRLAHSSAARSITPVVRAA